MNHPIQKRVQIDQIDLSDRTYIFTFEPPMSEMVLSIKQVGLLNSPVLEQIGQDRYRVVSGMRRIVALNHLAENEVTAKIYSGESHTPNMDLFLLNLYENAATRKFNVVEKALILDRLVRLFHVPENEIFEKYFPLLELGSNKIVLQRYLKLVDSEDYLRHAVFADEISLETILTLMEMPAKERTFIFHFFQQLKLGKNNQKEFFRLLHDISRMSGKSFSEILKQESIDDILTNENLTLPVKGNRVKEILKKMRFPRLTEVESRFNNLKKQMKLPPTIHLNPSPFFEGDKYFVEFNFRNKAEFDQALTYLSRLAENKELDTLTQLV